MQPKSTKYPQEIGIELKKIGWKLQKFKDWILKDPETFR